MTNEGRYFTYKETHDRIRELEVMIQEFLGNDGWILPGTYKETWNEQCHECRNDESEGHKEDCIYNRANKLLRNKK